MGSDQSSMKQQSNFLQWTVKICTFNDARYGKVSLYQHRSNKKDFYLLKEQWMNTKKDDLKKEHELKTISLIKSNYIARILAHFRKNDVQVCQTFSKHYLVFEFPPMSLQHEIESWKKISESQQQKQVNLWLSLVDAGARGMVHY